MVSLEAFYFPVVLEKRLKIVQGDTTPSLAAICIRCSFLFQIEAVHGEVPKAMIAKIPTAYICLEQNRHSQWNVFERISLFSCLFLGMKGAL